MNDRTRLDDAHEARVERVRRAMAPGALSMAYQPIFDLRDGLVVGVEALARFQIEPLRSPTRWFAEAASVGLGVDLEMTAIRAAIEGLRDLPEDVFLSINASPATVGSRPFLDLLDRVEAKRLVVEVAEHAAAETDGLTLAVEEMRAAGASLALDDTDADMRVLQIVLPLTPEFVKLDMQLCRNIDLDDARYEGARTVLRLMEEGEATPIAEGIQSRGEVRTLRELGVAHGQGYYMALPGRLPMPDMSDVVLRL